MRRTLSDRQTVGGWARPTLAAAACAVVMGLAPAAWAQTTTFTGSGTVQPLPDPVPPGWLALLALGSYDFGSLGTWDLASVLVFDTVSGVGAGGFQFTQGSDSFSGSLTSAFAPVALGPGFEISYTITSGTGGLAGVVGGGNSVVRLTGDLTLPPPFSYLEAGIMTVSVVPEPATALLMLGGVAALLGRRLTQAR